jgi:hypothetical protein
MNRERDRVALPQANDFRPRLHPGALLSQNKFTAREITSRL